MSDLRDRMFVAFDTETTGLSPQTANVVEIAGVRFTSDGNVISRFSTLANPGGPIHPKVTEIHGIDDRMVRRAPNSTEACRQFVRWLQEDDVLVAHNAGFDVAFIAHELTRDDIECPRNSVVDTLLCARLMALPVENCKLQTLVEHFGFRQPEGYHRALSDSLHVMAFFLEYLRLHPGMRLERLVATAGVTSHHDIATNSRYITPRMATLPAAIERGEVVTLRYDDGPVPGIPRRILPLTLRFVDGTDYLLAQCMSDGGVKEFRVDRIIDVSVPETDGVGST